MNAAPATPSPALRATLRALAEESATLAALALEPMLRDQAARLTVVEDQIAELGDSIADLAANGKRKRAARDPLRPLVAAVLTAEVQTGTEIERTIGRPDKDGSTRRTLRDLVQAGVAERTDGGWRLASSDGACPACGRSCDG